MVWGLRECLLTAGGGFFLGEGRLNGGFLVGWLVSLGVDVCMCAGGEI